MTSANTAFKLPEDGVLTPEHVGVNQCKFAVLSCAYVGI